MLVQPGSFALGTPVGSSACLRTSLCTIDQITHFRASTHLGDGHQTSPLERFGNGERDLSAITAPMTNGLTFVINLREDPDVVEADQEALSSILLWRLCPASNLKGTCAASGNCRRGSSPQRTDE